MTADIGGISGGMNAQISIKYADIPSGYAAFEYSLPLRHAVNPLMENCRARGAFRAIELGSTYLKERTEVRFCGLELALFSGPIGLVSGPIGLGKFRKTPDIPL